MLGHHGNGCFMYSEDKTLATRGLHYKKSGPVRDMKQLKGCVKKSSLFKNTNFVIIIFPIQMPYLFFNKFTYFSP